MRNSLGIIAFFWKEQWTWSEVALLEVTETRWTLSGSTFDAFDAVAHSLRELLRSPP